MFTVLRDVKQRKHRKLETKSLTVSLTSQFVNETLTFLARGGCVCRKPSETQH